MSKLLAENVELMRVAFAHQESRCMQERAGGKAEPPQVQTHPDYQRESPIENRKRPRRAAHEHWLCQSHMKRNLITFDVFWTRHGFTV